MAALERPTRLLIREGSQPDQFLAACDEDEFHSVRGLLWLLCYDHEEGGDSIVKEDRPPIVFLLYRDERYLIRLYLPDPSTVQVMRIWRRGDATSPV